MSNDEERAHSSELKFNADEDYELPMDDVELSLLSVSHPGLERVFTRAPGTSKRLTNVRSEGEGHSSCGKDLKRPECEKKVEESDRLVAPLDKELGEGVKVVSSKDLDKLDPKIFKFFVIPDNEDEIPSENLVNTQPEESPSPQNSQAEFSEGDASDDNDEGVQPETEDLNNEEVPPETEDVNNEEVPPEETPVSSIDLDEHCPSDETPDSVGSGEPITLSVSLDENSPLLLIYENPLMSRDVYSLLAAALVQSNVTANLGSVVTLTLLKYFPNTASLLASEDPYSKLPQDFELIPQLPWVLRRLRLASLRLEDGVSADEAASFLGPYALAVWKIFGERQKDVTVPEDALDLKAYLRWRQCRD